LEIKPLAAYGIEKTALKKIAAKARQASSMKGNPIELTDEELLAILHNAF